MGKGGDIDFVPGSVFYLLCLNPLRRVGVPILKMKTEALRNRVVSPR